MGSLKQQMAADVSAVFFNILEFADSATYNGATITVVPQIGESNVKGNEFSNDGSADRAEFFIKVSDVALPVPGDVIAHAGKTWTVVRVLESDDAMHRVLCTAGQSAIPWG
jgi:hypothetical protein